MLSPALAGREFRLLLTGVTINSLGSAVAPVALAFAVLDLGGSATQLGLVVAAYALAEVVTVLWGGVLGDRLPRQLVARAATTAAALSQATAAALLLTGHATIGLLGAIGLVNGGCAALAGPSSNALTRQTVDEADLPAAITLRRLSQNTAQVIGYSLGGLLVASVGSGWAIAIDAVALALAAVCFGLIRVPSVAAPPTTSALSDLRGGAAEVFRHTWLYLLIGQALLYHLVFGGTQAVLGPIEVGDRLGRAVWGWTLAALMVGFMVGGLITLRWRPVHALRSGTMLLTLTGALPLAIAWADSTAPLLIAAFLHGLGLEIFSVGWDLSIQQNVAPEALARVYAFDLVGSFVARPAGLALTGPVSLALGVDTWLVIVAAIMSGSALLSLGAPSVRHLERRSTT